MKYWKRFAFFERSNLTLPPSVLNDVLPPHLFPNDGTSTSASSGSGTGSGSSARNSNQSSQNARASTRSSARTGTGTDNPNSDTEQGSQLQLQGDKISLVIVNGAGVPIASIKESSDPSLGVNGMIHTLSACSTYGYVHPTNLQQNQNDDTNTNMNTIKDGVPAGGAKTNANTNANANMSSGEKETDANKTNSEYNHNSTSTKEAFQFSSTGQTLSIPQSAQKSGNVNGSLVLAFLSSKAAHYVHCLDLTVRCNPLHKSSTEANINANLNAGAGANANANLNVGAGMNMNHSAALQKNKSAGKKEEELDGWRGFFQPFAYDYKPSTTASASMPGAGAGTGDSSGDDSSESNRFTQYSTAKIKAIAVCSDHDSEVITLGRNIYVACITEDPQSVGITVHRNPHLYLNNIDCLEKRNRAGTNKYSNISVVGETSQSQSQSQTATLPNITPKIECFQPMSKFDQKYRGKPICVDIQLGIVAVGTDSGMVILYQFITNGMNSGSSNSAIGGCNGTNKLAVLMEIHPPHASSTTESTGAGAGATNAAAPSARERRAGNSNPSHNGNSSSKNSAQSSVRYAVSAVKIITERIHDTTTLSKKTNNAKKQVKVFVTYHRHSGDLNLNVPQNVVKSNQNQLTARVSKSNSQSGSGGGVCCYDLGAITLGASFASTPNSTNSQLAPHARYDLDGRGVATSCLCDVVVSRQDRDGVEAGLGSNVNASTTLDTGMESSPIQNQDGIAGSAKFMVARSDGLYTYSSTDKISVSPIDGSKIAMCQVPPPPVSRRQYNSHEFISRNASRQQESNLDNNESKTNSDDDERLSNLRTSESGASYVLIATTDLKSGRDAVDIYDASNKLVAFHLLLSPGHRALGAVGITTTPRSVLDGNKRGGLSSGVIFTSGGSIVTLTEKVTSDKVSLLVQKNLYAAAISMAFADPNYQSADITSLFRKHAEHLYRKGDFAASMDQYIYSIGSLEPSHVIFRFLDAPKIPLLTKYLEELRSLNIATSVHCELLRTCYLKLNDVSKAEKISATLSKSMSSTSCNSIISSLLHNPLEALATICSFDAPQVVEALKTHGATLAKALPKEVAGIVIMLCDGVYMPTSVNGIGSPSIKRDILKESLNSSDRPSTCEMYPVHLFSPAFLENPKLLRVILAHCGKNKRGLDSSLKRMLLELTLEEWNAAKKASDLDREDVRRREAIAMLSDPRASVELGDYEALVVVQQQNFSDGMIMLYEKLQLAPMLMEKYAEDGSYKARRQMLAMCRSDPELLADVLGHFVSMASKMFGTDDDEQSINSESDVGELLDDIKEALSMARSQSVLPPVRVARILAGDGIGQFSEEHNEAEKIEGSLPLSVALDYISVTMDEQSQEIDRLKSNIEEYNTMCNEMESEINELTAMEKNSKAIDYPHGINIDDMYSKLMDSVPENAGEKKSELASEEFWRQMEHSSDRFETLARFFAKDILE